MSLTRRNYAAYELAVQDGRWSQAQLDRAVLEYERVRARGWRARRAMGLVRYVGKWLDACYLADTDRELGLEISLSRELRLFFQGKSRPLWLISVASSLDSDAAAYQMVEEGWWG